MSRLSDLWQLHSLSTRTSSSYDFFLAIWGVRMDVVGPISPPSFKGYWFILAIINYFSKWIEAIPLKKVKTSDVIKFIKHHVIYRFGEPRRIVHNNGHQFLSQVFKKFCNKFRIQSVSSTHTIQPLASLQKHLTKPLRSFSWSSSKKVNATGTTN